MLLASVFGIHKAWAWVVIIGNAIAGLWVLSAARWPALRSRAMWWFTAVVEFSVFVQVGLGVWLYSHEKRNVPQFHMFYGFVIFVTVGLLYQYRAQMRGRLELLYGLGGLFIMGLGIRAVLQVGS